MIRGETVDALKGRCQSKEVLLRHAGFETATEAHVRHEQCVLVVTVPGLGRDRLIQP